MITEQELVQFLAEELSVKPSRLETAAQLGKDLGVDGEDAAELMQAFAKRFNVNLAGYDHSNYFGPEAGFNPFMLLFPSWWRHGRSRNGSTILAGGSYDQCLEKCYHILEVFIHPQAAEESLIFGIA